MEQEQGVAVPVDVHLEQLPINIQYTLYSNQPSTADESTITDLRRISVVPNKLNELVYKTPSLKDRASNHRNVQVIHTYRRTSKSPGSVFEIIDETENLSNDSDTISSNLGISLDPDAISTDSDPISVNFQPRNPPSAQKLFSTTQTCRAKRQKTRRISWRVRIKVEHKRFLFSSQRVHISKSTKHKS